MIYKRRSGIQERGCRRPMGFLGGAQLHGGYSLLRLVEFTRRRKMQFGCTVASTVCVRAQEELWFLSQTIM